jgi:hypothetical protein
MPGLVLPDRNYRTPCAPEMAGDRDGLKAL